MHKKGWSRLFLALLSVIAIAVIWAVFVSVSFIEDIKNSSRALAELRRQLLDWPFVYPDLDPRNDPAVIRHIRQFVLEPPSREEYNLQHPDWTDPSEGKHTSKVIVPQYFADMKNGVFFEAGALDGETVSTTLYLERELGWSGMLVEMTPLNHDIIRSKHRKASFAPVCLSPKPWPLKKSMVMEYNPQAMLTRWGATIVEERKSWINKNPQPGTKTYDATVECYPLQTLLLAANMTTINFFSLDLEGAELQVLRTLEWEKFQIDVEFFTYIYYGMYSSLRGLESIHTRTHMG